MNSKTLRTACWVLAAGLAAWAAPVAQSPDVDRHESTRSTVARWVETQQIISKEKKDWQLGKEVLLQRISLIENEIGQLERKRDATRGSIAEAEGQRRELEQRNEAMKRASAELAGIIGPLERKTRELLATLPDPIVERVRPLSERIPEDPDDTRASLGERFQNVIGILNEVNKFNGDITVTNEIRELADGSTAEVTAIYVGLGQAYYVTSSGRAAGVGRPTPEGWEWTAANHLAPEIAQAVAIVKGDVPAFVPLPVEIR